MGVLGASDLIVGVLGVELVLNVYEPDRAGVTGAGLPPKL